MCISARACRATGAMEFSVHGKFRPTVRRRARAGDRIKAQWGTADSGGSPLRFVRRAFLRPCFAAHRFPEAGFTGGAQNFYAEIQGERGKLLARPAKKIRITACANGERGLGKEWCRRGWDNGKVQVNARTEGIQKICRAEAAGGFTAAR